MTTSAFTVDNAVALRDNSVNTAFVDFNRAACHNPDALFVFYEGHDSDYYYPRIMQYARRPVESIKCNGKEKVIRVYKLLIAKPEYDKYRRGFFVDKDFDINSDPVLSDFYVTSGYSIENFYLSDRCMEEILKQMFFFHTGDALLVSVLNDYCNMRQNYFEAILLFNTWYCAIKRKYKVLREDVHLDKEMPKGFVRFDCPTKVVQKQYTITEIEAVFPSFSTYHVTQDEMSNAEAYIRTSMLKNLRGKYVLHFLEKYIEYLIELFKIDPVYKDNKRIINIQSNNVMAILSPFADTEQELIDYILDVAS